MKKNIILLSCVFTAAAILAFYYEYLERKLVRYLFKLFQGNKIQFIGKGFHLFADTSFVLAFAIFCTFTCFLLAKTYKPARLPHTVLIIVLFFASHALTCFIDSTALVLACTNCTNGIRNLNYNEINYNLHFILSLVIAAMPLSLLQTRRYIKPDRQQ